MDGKGVSWRKEKTGGETVRLRCAAGLVMTAFLRAAEDEGCSDACRAKLVEMFNKALVSSIQYQNDLLKKLDRRQKR